jgi:hypothetical protein
MKEYQQPDASGHFGIYGGSFVSETLTHAINELKDAYARYQNDPAFIAEFEYELAHFVGRPSPVYHADRMTREMGGAQIFLKREDPESHRRTQGQQHHRPGHARQAHGQAARDRRDRRRPARRSHGHHLCPLRAGMCGLHGQ